MTENKQQDVLAAVYVSN